MSHFFFEAFKIMDKLDSWNALEGPPFPKAVFFKTLKQAHPFVFDQKTTNQKLEMSSGAEFHDLAERVADFSLPYKTSLYLLTKPHKIYVQTQDLNMYPTGYLIQEDTPETFTVYSLMIFQSPEEVRRQGGHEWIPIVDVWNLDLKDLRHDKNDVSLLFHLTKSISVQRIGVEKGFKTTVKNRADIGGRTQLKYPNLVHVADKVEYEYVTPIGDGDIKWEFGGWWRGHWRAFYAYRGDEKIKDSYGRNVVDYGRLGKDRAGNKECVPGYTWVTEHTKGNPLLAEVKTHMVIKK